MPEFVFSTEQTIALDAIAAGASITQAAAQDGVHRNTIANWRRATIGFQLALCNAPYDRALLMREQTEELMVPALDTIRGVLSDEKASPSVRLKAALAIVNIAMSQVPPQKRYPFQIEDTLLVPERNPSVDVRDSAQNAQSARSAQDGDAAAKEQLAAAGSSRVQTIRHDQPKIGPTTPAPAAPASSTGVAASESPQRRTTTPNLHKWKSTQSHKPVSVVGQPILAVGRSPSTASDPLVASRAPARERRTPGPREPAPGTRVRTPGYAGSPCRLVRHSARHLAGTIITNIARLPANRRSHYNLHHLLVWAVACLLIDRTCRNGRIEKGEFRCLSSVSQPQSASPNGLET